MNDLFNAIVDIARAGIPKPRQPMTADEALQRKLDDDVRNDPRVLEYLRQKGEA